MILLNQLVIILYSFLPPKSIVFPRDMRRDTSNFSKTSNIIKFKTEPLYSDTVLSPVESLFIRITGKEKLRQVGYEHFRVYGGTYLNTQNLSPAYTLGPGDEVTIYLSGSMENTFTSVIDKRGTIFVPGIGPVKIAGMSINQAESFLNQLAGKKWSNVKVFISPGRIRGIQVYLTGETPHPGAYVLKAKSTVIDLLFIAGGILKTGTLRKVEIIHKNGTKSTIDLYPFIFGGKPGGAELYEGDIVVIPPLQNVIAIDGSVYKPGIYETTPRTTLWELTKWAGIIPFNQKRAVIKRLENDSIRVFDIPSNRWKSFKLKTGDYITVPISRYLKGGYIYVDGNIKKPGYYSFKKGIILKEAIEKAGGFLYPPYGEIVIIRHKEISTKSISIDLTASDTFELNDRDSIIVFRKDVFEQKEPVTVNGYVEHPGIFQWHENFTLKNLILLARPKAGASIDHIIIFKKQKRKTNIVHGKRIDSVLLDPGDVVFVPQDTFRTSNIHVFVNGEVRYPGIYNIPRGTSVQYVLNLAGGITHNAYEEGIYIKRRMKRQDLYERVSEFNLYIIDSTNRYMPDSLLSLLKGRIMYSLPATSGTRLEDGDTVFVPSKTHFIYITGATVQPHSIPYTNEIKLQDVLDNTPLLRLADKKHAFAVGINGEIHFKNLYPGDIVFIPFKKETSHKILENLTDISSIIYQLATTLFIIYQIQK